MIWIVRNLVLPSWSLSLPIFQVIIIITIILLFAKKKASSKRLKAFQVVNWDLIGY